MRYLKLLALWSCALFTLWLTSCTQCTRQHDPQPALDKFHHEREVANEKIPTLTEDGRVPPKEGAVVASGNSVEEKFSQFCSSCHGMGGKGDGPGGQALNPRPRNFTDAAWQAKTTDDRIANVIKNGGAANGLSAVMAPWGSMLSDDEIKGLVKKIRGFKGK